MKKKLGIVTLLVAVAGLIGVALFNQPPVGSVGAFVQPKAPDYICHATPPDTAANGWNKQSPNLLQLVSQGHRTEHDADIIPPYQGATGWYGGKNWDEEGQAIHKNDCEVPVIDVCENLDDVQETVPDHYYQPEEGICEEQTPVCTDKKATNYDSEVDKSEYENNEVCKYDRPNPDKSVEIVEACDGTSDVTIYGGNTRRTWRVNGEEKWVEKYSTVVWEDVTSPAVVEWWHENSQQWKPADSEYTITTPAENCDVPEDDTPQPEQPKSEPGPASAPVCSDSVPGEVANIYVDQGTPNDGKLEVRWLPAEPKGSKAHIRYSEVNGEWRYALLNTDNDGVEEIGELQNGVHYWFQVAQVNGCAVGQYSVSFDPLP